MSCRSEPQIGQIAQESKPVTRARRYPASARAYNKKDYEYLSKFPRATAAVILRGSSGHEDLERSREHSDVESDLFTTSSSVDNTTISSVSSTISCSVSSFKDDASLTDMEINHRYKSRSRHEQSHCDQLHRHSQQQQLQCDNNDSHREGSKLSTLTPSVDSMEKSDLRNAVEEKPGNDSKSERKATKLGSPSAIENSAIEATEAPSRSRSSKVKYRQADTPAVLPKFGSWDAKNPSTGEAYTLIFKRLRDEKKSGAVPVCESTTLPDTEDAELSLGLETKAKEPLVPNSHARKEPLRRTKTELIQGRTRWILCCKGSVLDD